jgi:hypothetical protein
MRNKAKASKLNILRKSKNFEYSKFESMTSFIVAFKKLNTSLVGVDMRLPDDFYTLKFINALDSAFPVMTDRWRHESRDPTKPVVLTKLYSEATDEARNRNPVSKDTNLVLYTNNPRGGRGGNRGGNSNNL